jgi:hypothetical protein
MVAMISLDIKGAFDHAEWPHILRQLEDAATPQYLVRCVASYFKDRTVKCEEWSMTLERGMPSRIGAWAYSLEHPI